jgi:hypothetical protein
MNGETWTSYKFQLAPQDLLCQFRYPLPDINGDAYCKYTGYARDFAPYYDLAAGLEWKLTGIAREQLDRMPEEVRRQVMSQSMGYGLANRLLGLSGTHGALLRGSVGPLEAQLCGFKEGRIA